jgi:hypothetical protein
LPIPVHAARLLGAFGGAISVEALDAETLVLRLQLAQRGYDGASPKAKRADSAQIPIARPVGPRFSAKRFLRSLAIGRARRKIARQAS